MKFVLAEKKKKKGYIRKIVVIYFYFAKQNDLYRLLHKSCVLTSSPSTH